MTYEEIRESVRREFRENFGGEGSSLGAKFVEVNKNARPGDKLIAPDGYEANGDVIISADKFRIIILTNSGINVMSTDKYENKSIYFDLKNLKKALSKI